MTRTPIDAVKRTPIEIDIEWDADTIELVVNGQRIELPPSAAERMVKGLEHALVCVGADEPFGLSSRQRIH